MTATMNTSQGVPQDMPGDEYYTMTLEKENTSKVLVPSSQTDEKLPYPENDSAAENDSGHEYNDDIDGTSGLGSSQRDIISGDDDESCDYSGPHKLFVGQVPRNMEEQDLFPIFKKFGPMEDVVVIRDKHTGQHRGCAFVTFLNKESADDCESELHDQFVMPGGKRPVQIRPAGYKDGTVSIHLLSSRCVSYFIHSFIVAYRNLILFNLLFIFNYTLKKPKTKYSLVCYLEIFRKTWSNSYFLLLEKLSVCISFAAQMVLRKAVRL
jgi:RNA recognition motif-containing protein